jgi:hypothetical protein
VFAIFCRLTPARLLPADAVTAVDPLDPSRELPLYPPRRRRGAGGVRTFRVLSVVLDPHQRDEQVCELRGWLAAKRPLPVTAPSTLTRQVYKRGVE